MTTNNIQPLAIDISTIIGQPGPIEMIGYEADHPNQEFVPKPEDNYLPQKEFVREYRSWHNSPGERGFFIVGPTGSGKTTGVLHLNSFLNIPTILVHCHRDKTMLELLGSMMFVMDESTGSQSVTQYVLGPVSKAFKFGFTLVLDELGSLDPGVSIGLNEIVRGNTLLIEETGEVIKRHPMFRVVATSNDWGRGDGATRLAGLQQQNAAFLRRWWLFERDYPHADEEKAILAQKYPSVPDVIRHGMVDVANRLRSVIIGVAKGDDADRASLDVDFSTATLLNWCDTLLRFTRAPNPVQYALEICSLRACNAEERTVIERACQDVMGEHYQGTPS